MTFNIATLLKNLGMDDTHFYWGKRLVRALPQPGTFKGHSVVATWDQPDHIRIDLRAGISGRTLNDKELSQYPLGLQSETFFEFKVQSEDDTDESKGRAGKGSAGGKSSGGRKLKRTDTDQRLSGMFDAAHTRDIATHAELTKAVVMGMEIGKNALDTVFKTFCAQVQAAKVLTTELLATAGKAVTRYTPPAFMSPRGDEQKVYKYDRAKNEVMFGVAPS